MHPKSKIAILQALLLAACASLHAQSNFATLSGRVQDPAQTSVSGARVTVTAKATATARQTATNYDGLFDLPNLAPGEYSLQVTAVGFADQKRDIVLEVGQHMGLDLSLQLGEKHESVSVVASAENLKTQDASIGEVVEPRSIQDLPLNGGC